MINIDKTNQFGIMWEINDSSNAQHLLGPVVLIVGNQQEILPRYIDTETTLQVVFSNMQSSFTDPIFSGGTDGSDLGDVDVNAKQLDNGEIPNILDIELTELGDQRGDYLGGVIMCLGYSGKEERLFYSSNNGKSYNEIRLPRGTVENVIMSLPSFEELEQFRENKNKKEGCKKHGVGSFN